MLYSVLLSDLTVGTVTVSWTASTANNSPIIAYLVAYSSSTTAVAPVVGVYTTTDGATTTTDITDLTVSADYTFTVTAVNDIGLSVTSTATAPLHILPGVITFVGYELASHVCTSYFISLVFIMCELQVRLCQ
jgi:Fibronectin type III domain